MFPALIDPVAFALGPIQIHWYGILMGVATLLGLWLAIREGERFGMGREVFFDLSVWVLPSAIVGARLYYVGFEWDYYASHPADILAVWKGGLAIHGGLFGAFAAGFLYVKKQGLPFWQIADVIVPSVILGQAVGRWGNFINQEAHGGEVSRSFLHSLHLPDWMIEQMQIGGAYYQPTFLYESVWDVTGFVLLLLLRKRNARYGEMFLTYVIWYSLGRFFIEGLRTDSLAFTGPAWLKGMLDGLWAPMAGWFEPGAMVGGNIRIAQLVSLLGVGAGIFLMLWRRIAGHAGEGYRTERAKLGNTAIETKEV